MGTTLHYPYEIRDSKEYFDDIADLEIAPDMLKLAEHIVETKEGEFDPSQFNDRYEEAVVDMLKRKQTGIPAAHEQAPHQAPNVINLMDALRRSISAEKSKIGGKHSENGCEKRSQARRGPAGNVAAHSRQKGQTAGVENRRKTGNAAEKAGKRLSASAKRLRITQIAAIPQMSCGVITRASTTTWLLKHQRQSAITCISAKRETGVTGHISKKSSFKDR